MNRRAYNIWGGMMRRCYNPKDAGYKNYGGRGIKVCDRWHQRELFCLDMGDPPDGLTLERIDNDEDYEPLNCRWATQAEQNRNRRNNVRIAYNGEEMTVTDWAIKLGINRNVLHERLRVYNLPPEIAFFPDLYPLANYKRPGRYWPPAQ